MKLSAIIFEIQDALARLKTVLYYRLLFKSIGRGTVVHTPYHLLNSENATIGRNVLIRRGLRLEVLDRPDGRQASVQIGDHTNIEQNCHIICQNKVVIGERVSITGNCALVDTTHPYGNDEAQTGINIDYNDDELVIGDNVFVGFGTVILPGTRIGANSYVGALSVVKGTFPERSLLYGAPARLVKKI
jgi:acetyltransferase-like isoleucine patch superfamily enzyme